MATSKTIVHVVMWDRSTEADPAAWVHATEAGANQRRYDIVKQHWHQIAAYDGYPQQVPADHEEAAQIWEDACEQLADPKIGVITIDAVTLGA